MFQGKIDTLHFEHSDGLVTPTNIDVPFIMSGKWPHHMQNTNNIKYTLALGAPWDASLDDTAYMDLLTRSYEKYGEHYLSFDGLNLRQGWTDLFEKGRGYEEQVERCINKNQLAF